MSALDKMETDYGQRSEKIEPTNLRKGEKAAARVTKISCHSTPARNGSKQDIAKVSTAESVVSSSFHDLSFASPMEISTPQIFRIKRLSSGSKRSSTPRHRSLSATKIPVTKTICKENVTANSIGRTATSHVTPRRSMRVNSTEKVQKPMKKKRVFEGQDDNSKGTGSNDNHDKSDFFRSLLVENISLEESSIGHGCSSSTGKITTSEETGAKDSCVRTIENSQHKFSNVLAQVDKDIHTDNEQELEIEKTSKSKCDDATSTSVEHVSNHIQAHTENKTEGRDKICFDDLPQIPTRRDNKENNSTSVVGKTLEIPPGKNVLMNFI